MGAALPVLNRFQLFPLLGKLLSQEFTGTLIVHQDAGNLVLKLDRGHPVNATSEDVRLSFPAFLLKKKRLTRDRLKALLDESQRKLPAFEALLLQSSVVTPKEMIRLQRELADQVFCQGFLVHNGAYRLASGELSRKERSLDPGVLNAHSGLFRAILEAGDKDVLSRFFRDRWDVLLEKTSDFYRYLIQARSVFFEEDITASLMSAEPTARKILEQATNRVAALKALFALAYCGMLRFRGTAAPQTRQSFSLGESISEKNANKTIMIVPSEHEEADVGRGSVGAAPVFREEPVLIDEEAVSSTDTTGTQSSVDKNIQDEFQRFVQEETGDPEALARLARAPEPGESPPWQGPISVDSTAGSPPTSAPQEEEHLPTLRIEDALGAAGVAELLAEPEPRSESDLLVEFETPTATGSTSEVTSEPLPDTGFVAGTEGTDSSRDGESDTARPSQRAFQEPPPVPPRPDTPDPGVDEGLERILEDVYRTMLSRNLYQILGTTPGSPLSAIRDAASRLLHKYGPDQYRSFMLSQRARTLLDLVCAEIQRSRDVLTDMRERLAYDRYLEVAYPPGLRAHLETLFEAEALFEAGRGALKAKEFGRAAELFGKATLLNPREPEYIAVAGWATYQTYVAGIATREESLPKAYAAIQRALAVDPRHQRSMLFLGRIHRELNEREEALDWYERLLKIDPTNEEASVWTRELKPWVESRRRSASATSSWARFAGLFRRK